MMSFDGPQEDPGLGFFQSMISQRRLGVRRCWLRKIIGLVEASE